MPSGTHRRVRHSRTRLAYVGGAEARQLCVRVVGSGSCVGRRGAREMQMSQAVAIARARGLMWGVARARGLSRLRERGSVRGVLEQLLHDHDQALLVAGGHEWIPLDRQRAVGRRARGAAGGEARGKG